MNMYGHSMKGYGLQKYIYDFNNRPAYIKDMIDDLKRQGKLILKVQYYNPVYGGVYNEYKEGYGTYYCLYKPDSDEGIHILLTKKAYEYAISL